MALTLIALYEIGQSHHGPKLKITWTHTPAKSAMTTNTAFTHSHAVAVLGHYYLGGGGPKVAGEMWVTARVSTLHLGGSGGWSPPPHKTTTAPGTQIVLQYEAPYCLASLHYIHVQHKKAYLLHITLLQWPKELAEVFRVAMSRTTSAACLHCAARYNLRHQFYRWIRGNTYASAVVCHESPLYYLYNPVMFPTALNCWNIDKCSSSWIQ